MRVTMARAPPIGIGDEHVRFASESIFPAADALMQPLLALAPVVLLLLLLVVARWPAAWAGTASAAVAVPIAILAFGYGEDAMGPSLAGPLLEALFQAATILWIIFPALWIHEYQMRTGATGQLGRYLGRLSDDPRIAALLIAWFFTLFMEGAAGFGTPIALAAPLLVTMGFRPVPALVLVIIGNAAGVSFGAVGTPMAALLAEAEFDPEMLSLLVVLLNAAAGWAMAALVYRLAGSGVGPGGRGAFFWVTSATLLFFAPAALLAWTTGTELPTLGGALVGALLFIWLVRRQVGRANAAPDEGPGLIRAGLPYLTVLALILVTRLVTPVTATLRAPAIEWRLFDRFGGTMEPLYHPGTMLLAGLAIAAIALPRGMRPLPAAAIGAARRLPMVAIALVAVLTLARLMMHSGMIARLAQSAVALVGDAWPLFAPVVGALGSFVTGSATSSNILFGSFQLAVADMTSASPMLVIAAQAMGAAAGNLIAPHNIVAGAATVGLIGKEGEVLKRTLPACLLYVAIGGAIAMALDALA